MKSFKRFLALGLIGISVCTFSHAGDESYEIDKRVNENITLILDNKTLSSLPEDFVALGPVHTIKDPKSPHSVFYLSHLAPWIEPGRQNHAQATQLCKEKGARLPTKTEYEALGRAMSSDGTYNYDLIPTMRGCYFWSSTVDPNGPDSALVFDGEYNFIGTSCNTAKMNTRCVVAVQ